MSFVNVAPQAKTPALLSKSIDITTNFYNGHDTMSRQLGPDMGFLAWKDVGINPYGNSVIVNGEYLRANRGVVEKFVRVSQRAFIACVADANPCLDTLMTATSGLNRADQEAQWNRVKELMTDEFTMSGRVRLFRAGPHEGRLRPG